MENKWVDLIYRYSFREVGGVVHFMVGCVSTVVIGAGPQKPSRLKTPLPQC